MKKLNWKNQRVNQNRQKLEVSWHLVEGIALEELHILIMVSKQESPNLCHAGKTPTTVEYSLSHWLEKNHRIVTGKGIGR